MNDPMPAAGPAVFGARVYYVGVFEDRSDAETAARELRERGFADGDIGFVWRDDSGKEHTKAGKLATEGAATGVVLGGIIGAWAALLIPGLGPVVSGGLL